MAFAGQDDGIDVRAVIQQVLLHGERPHAVPQQDQRQARVPGPDPGREQAEHGEEIIISRAGKPAAKVVPLTRAIDRSGRGSLRGKLVAAEDWNPGEGNEAIARDFGMTR